MKLLLSALPLLAFTACTDDAFSAQAAGFEGIYQVDTHLRNTAACSPGGEAVDDTQRFAFARRVDLVGNGTLAIVSCSSVDDCRASASQSSGGPFSFGFTLTAADGDALTGVETSSGYGDANGWCEMPQLSNLRLEMDGEALRLEKRTQIGAAYSPAGGACTTDKGRAAAETAPCSELETLTATRVDRL